MMEECSRNYATNLDLTPSFLTPSFRLPGMVRFERGLRAALIRLPGRKVLFSNAPEHYSRRVLEILGIADLFGAVFCIEHTRFRPKPHPSGFYRLLARLRLKPAQCVMVEDTLENLKTAKKLGMKTAWIGPVAQRPAYVDFAAKSVPGLTRSARLRQKPNPAKFT